MKKVFVLSLVLVFAFGGLVLAQEFKYKVKSPHMGGDVTPSEAYAMMQKDPEHTFLVDVRTRPEYQAIGHPVGAYNIPYQFWTGKFGGKNYTKALNENFGKDLLRKIEFPGIYWGI